MEGPTNRAAALAKTGPKVAEKTRWKAALDDQEAFDEPTEEDLEMMGDLLNEDELGEVEAFVHNAYALRLTGPSSRRTPLGSTVNRHEANPASMSWSSMHAEPVLCVHVGTKFRGRQQGDFTKTRHQIAQSVKGGLWNSADRGSPVVHDHQTHQAATSRLAGRFRHQIHSTDQIHGVKTGGHRGGSPPRTWEKRLGLASRAPPRARSPSSSTCLAMCKARLAPAPAAPAR